MNRFVLLIFLCLAGAARLAAEAGAPDPVFATIPFEKWLQQNDGTHMRWSARVYDPQLTSHQRLAAFLQVEVDGAELAKRRGKGQLMLLLQVNDERGAAWQDHQEIDLERIEEGIKASNALYSQSFFVMPGDYRLSIALFATATGEHSVIKRKLHVAPLKNDPLPDLWRDLPPVEFIPRAARPDAWYLPSIQGELRAAVSTRDPVQVDLLVNLTPAERLSGSSRVQNRNLGFLIPAAKVLSQVKWLNGRFNIELLDLARRRVAFEQRDLQSLDWARARDSLQEINPGVIDVRSLENRQYSAEFFLNQISRHVQARQEEPLDAKKVVLILSSVLYFEPGQEMHPIETSPRPGVSVIYIRYQPTPPVILRPGRSDRRVFIPRADELEPLLAPLRPQLFDVATPEQFRKALAQILAEVGEL